MNLADSSQILLALTQFTKKSPLSSLHTAVFANEWECIEIYQYRKKFSLLSITYSRLHVPPDRNDLYCTSLISNIWDLHERNLLGVLSILSIFLLFHWREVLAGVYGLLGPAGCRGMEVLTEQGPAANSPNPPWLYATRTQQANLGFLVEIANLSESFCYQAKSFTIPSRTVCSAHTVACPLSIYSSE